jgi:hypothetical protein
MVRLGGKASQSGVLCSPAMIMRGSDPVTVNGRLRAWCNPFDGGPAGHRAQCLRLSSNTFTGVTGAPDVLLDEMSFSVMVVRESSPLRHNSKGYSGCA